MDEQGWRLFKGCTLRLLGWGKGQVFLSFFYCTRVSSGSFQIRRLILLICGIIVHLKAGSTTGRDLNHIRFTERTRPNSRWLGNVSSFLFPKVSSNVDVASHADFCNLWTQVLMVEGRQLYNFLSVLMQLTLLKTRAVSIGFQQWNNHVIDLETDYQQIVYIFIF